MKNKFSKLGVLLALVLAVTVFASFFVGCSSSDSSDDSLLGDEETTTEQITDYSELLGKVVYSIGENNVPDQVFKAILDEEGIAYEASTEAIDGKVALAYIDSAASTAGVLTSGQADYVIGAEPSVTALIAGGDYEIVSDVQEAYATAFDTEDGFPQAVLIAKDGYAASNPDEVYAVMQTVANSSTYLSENLDTAVTNFTDAGSVALTSLTADAVTRSNLVFKTKETQGEAINTLLSNFSSGYSGDLPAADDADFFVDVPTSGETPTETVKIYTPDGAPALALASAFEESFADVNVVTDSTTLPAKFSSAGDADMAIVPSNMAVTIHNNFGAEFIATVTYGNLYMVACA